MACRQQAPDMKLVSDGEDTYIVIEGVKIAKRGKNGTATWITLEPGWTVTDVDYPEKIKVEYDPPH